jgi:hypothetical protein
MKNSSRWSVVVVSACAALMLASAGARAQSPEPAQQEKAAGEPDAQADSLACLRSTGTRLPPARGCLSTPGQVVTREELEMAPNTATALRHAGVGQR